jgi:uncharacterized protein (DUF885 family)
VDRVDGGDGARVMMSRVMAAVVTMALILGPIANGVKAAEGAAASQNIAQSGGLHIGTDSGDVDASTSAVQPLIERYWQDRETLRNLYDTPMSARVNKRFASLYNAWIGELRKLDFEKLDHESKVDYVLFENHLKDELRLLELREKRQEEMLPLLPFAKTIVELDEARLRKEVPDGEKQAAALAGLIKEIAKTRESAEAGLTKDAKPASANGSAVAQPVHVSRIVAARSAMTVDGLRKTLKQWFEYYHGYDPTVTWWVSEPDKQADAALEAYANFVREKLVGIKADDTKTIIGDPVGGEALNAELSAAMIPYTPEELIALAKNELAWCTKEMLRASHDMGYGDDWHKALEHVKGVHVAPGEQPEAIRKLAVEGIEYMKTHDLVTVPPLAEETWRMEMMTPERQLVNPFFTGGEVISVSYPTDTMTFEQRMMSMRGNNIPFSRSTVFHELIPGHYLQQFMSQRYRSYRRVFETPFWHEGNAFYWEMLLWDMGFPRTPEERAGMLFWRMHRCARIIFSLSFHLGLWTPQECVDFLVSAVGHEVDNATAEVRRSFNGSVGPLYQCAYMLGALQFRALHKELVESGKMTNRAFHDAILKEGPMPVEMVRADLTGLKVGNEFKTSWKFYGEIAAK